MSWLSQVLSGDCLIRSWGYGAEACAHTCPPALFPRDSSIGWIFPRFCFLVSQTSIL